MDSKDHNLNPNPNKKSPLTQWGSEKISYKDKVLQ